MKRDNLALTNTLKLPSRAQSVMDVSSLAEAREAVAIARSNGLSLRCLGAGSNVILAENPQGVICRVRHTGVSVVDQNDAYVWVDVGAGVNWHEFVLQALERGWFGLENLALIPGTVGAAPVQNIGAYGVEVAQYIDSVQIIDQAGSVQRLNPQQCCFGYRDSVFKQSENLIDGLGSQIIFSVRLRLSRHPAVNLTYEELARALAVKPALDASNASPSPQQVAQAVIGIRQRKLPDPDQFPNAGSFFKNPIVDQNDVERLSALGLRPYAFEGRFKVSAAQMIDMSGWKGVRHGDVGCWNEQPLVFVNYGNATAPEVLAFASAVQRSVQAKFQLALELEPSVVS